MVVAQAMFIIDIYVYMHRYIYIYTYINVYMCIFHYFSDIETQSPPQLGTWTLRGKEEIGPTSVASSMLYALQYSII